MQPTKPQTLAYGLAFVATLQRDGWPHLTPVWIDWDGEHVLFNTTVERLKAKHLARDPRVVIGVYNTNDPSQYVTVSGHAEMTTEGAWERQAPPPR